MGVNKIHIPDEKIDTIISKIVLNNLPELVRDYIIDQLNQKMTFQKIGEKLGINRSTVFKIFEGSYFPKKPQIRQKILEKYLSLI